MKKIFAIVLAASMILGMTVTAFALPAGSVFRYGDTNIYDAYDTEIDVPYRYSSGKAVGTPGWGWINGYCYYFTDPSCRNVLRNTTTPDGYQVDSEGRWTVNGVPQYNGYGSFKMGTDALYNGKSDDEIWKAMRSQLEQLFATSIHTDKDGSAGQAMMSYDTSVSTVGSNFAVIQADVSRGNPWLIAYFPSSWNDSPEVYSDLRNETYEKTLKLVLGDNVGQEMFNDIKAAGDPAKAGGKVIKFDANGNVIPIKKPKYVDGEFVGYRDAVEMEDVPSTTDGINWSLFDVSKWKNRKTDYGKTFNAEIETINGITSMVISVK